MGKNGLRTIAFLLVLSIIVAIPLNAQATELSSDMSGESILMVSDNVVITAVENENGDTILCEYTDGILTQRNTVISNQEGVVKQEYFNATGDADCINYLNVNSCGVIQESSGVSSYVTSGYTPFGAIQYRVVANETLTYKTMTVNLHVSNPITTTYTIKSWVGKVIDLVAILVSAGLGASGILSTFISNLLACLGIEVVAGAISSALSTTVASIKRTYTWQVYDSSLKIESFITGEENNIVDYGSSHYGEIYYDGVTIEDWGTNYMAAIFYDTTYAYTSWYVNRWIVASGNSYV